VKGHQDNVSADPDIWAQRNVLMDKKAKEHLPVAQRSARHFNVDEEPWQLWVEGVKVTKNILPTIYSAIHTPTSVEYWAQKHLIPPDIIKKVDWQMIGRSMHSLPRTRRIFITKHTSGMCGVGKFMKQWKEWTSDSCPRCGMMEDAPHVWRCKGAGTEEIWNKAVAELDTTLRRLNTDPTLHHIILLYLRSWWSGEGITYEAPRDFQELLQEQQNISWDRFFEGWLSSKWAMTQQQYYKRIKATRTGRRWAMAIVQKLWNTAWDLWEHRNGILHERENLVTRSIIIRLNARVSRIYNSLSS
jgi:hypothetical protein